MCQCKNGCSSLRPFELSPLNELYRRKRVSSITLIPFDPLLIIFSRHVYHIKMVCHIQEWLLADLLSYLP